LDGDAADRDYGDPGAPHRSPEAIDTVGWRERPSWLRGGGEDGTEADVVGPLRRVDLRVRMGADADQRAGPQDGARGRPGQVLLPEVDPVRLGQAGDIGAVIDQEQCPPGAELARLTGHP